jgi:hypothetical protein
VDSIPKEASPQEAFHGNYPTTHPEAGKGDSARPLILFSGVRRIVATRRLPGDCRWNGTGQSLLVRLPRHEQVASQTSTWLAWDEPGSYNASTSLSMVEGETCFHADLGAELPCRLR